MRTIEVARASGYSLQQVRDLERLGVLPPAVRLGNGYREYGERHVRALEAYRGLARAAGPVEARRLMASLWGRPLEEAAAAIGTVHVRLAREREETLDGLAALRAIHAEPGDVPEDGDAMTITELAGALRVRPSTLRFWEREGLLRPDRVTSLRARSYGLPAIRQARVVAALRGAGYGIPAVRGILRALPRLEEADGILRARLDTIAARSVALLRAGADLAAVLEADQAVTLPRKSHQPAAW